MAIDWFEFLRLETELALTFIESAKLVSSPMATAASLARARQALEEVRRRLQNPVGHGLNADEVDFLEKRCEVIQSALG